MKLKACAARKVDENAQQVENDETTSTQKCDFTVNERKDELNLSREKNKGMRRRRMEDEKFCVTFPLCDPGWYI